MDIQRLTLSINGYKITNSYKNGYLQSVKGSDGITHYTINEMSAFGRATQAIYGNGVRTSILEDRSEFVDTIISSFSHQTLGGDIQNLHYTYDLNGNIIQRDDLSIKDKYIEDKFSYDNLNRIVTVKTDSDVLGSYRKSIEYRYDKLGNIIYQSGLGNYSYNSSKPHAVTNVGSRVYKYDAQGNMVYRDGQRIHYQPMGKASVLTNKKGDEVRFYYGVGDKRFKKSTKYVDTYYIDKLYEEQVEVAKEKQICYIPIGSKTIGMHVQVVNTDYNQNSKYYKEKPYNRYFHTDTLGSITAITDDNGKVVERRSYEPFGKIRAMDYGTNDNKLPNITKETSRAFTGHENIEGFDGLIHMNARLYDSDIGRFLSADTIIQHPNSSQGYNRYSYVENNPLSAPDPTGHGFFSFLGKIFSFIFKHIALIASIVVSAVITMTLGPILMAKGALGAFWGTVATGAVAGFASGVIMTGSLKGGLAGAVWGAAGAFAAYTGAELAGRLAGAVNSAAAHTASLLKSGLTKLTAIKTLLHGLSSGIINYFRGGSFRAGFFSGLGSAFDIGTKGYGTMVGRTSIMAIIGGTFAKLGGGKFANGAMSAAFVHLFNGEIKKYIYKLSAMQIIAISKFEDKIKNMDIKTFNDFFGVNVSSNLELEAYKLEIHNQLTPYMLNGLFDITKQAIKDIGVVKGVGAPIKTVYHIFLKDNSEIGIDFIKGTTTLKGIYVYEEK